MTELLLDGYDGLVCDLDGVVYAGARAIDHAVEALESSRERGVTVVYATNNASRPPSKVAAHLRDLGLGLDDGAVVNSSMAAAHMLRESGGDMPTVLAVGGEGVAIALTEAGFTCVRAGDDTGDHEAATIGAVVQGYGPDVRAADLAAAAYAIQGGARWIATNTDLTLPTDRGIAPGNGSLVDAVRNAVGRDPEVAGKPMPVMYDMASRRIGASSPSRVLAIGDRLETDIEGARRGGYDSVLVLTGVHGFVDAAGAPPVQRPTYVVEDLRALMQPYRVEVWDGAPTEKPATHLSIEGLRGYLAWLWERVDAGAMTTSDAARAMREVAAP